MTGQHAGSVLMLAAAGDATADRVAAELAVRGVPAIRVDAAQFPRDLALTATLDPRDRWRGAITATGDGRAVVDLAEVSAVYYRHPEQFVLDERMSAPERAFAFREARRGFGGVVQALGARWVNPPVAAARAEFSEGPSLPWKPISAFAQLRGCVLNVIECNRCGASMRGRPVTRPVVGC